MRENVKIIIDSVKTRGYYEKREITRKGGKMARNKLKGRIVEKYLTQEKFAEVLDCTPSTVTNKLKNIRDMKRAEIERWCELLDIPREEIHEYFFED